MEHRALVVGAGSIGRRHLRNLQTLGVKSLAACDPDPERLRFAADELGARTFGDLDEALTSYEPELVFVCTPPTLHLEQALLAVSARAAVFIEKPLVPTAAGIRRLTAAIAAHGVVTMVGCNMRFHPGPRMLKHLIEVGALGDVLAATIHTGSYLPGWRPDRDHRATYSAETAGGGGAVLDCIHEVDLALWYFGPIAEVAAMMISGENIDISAEGGASLLARHAAGSLTSINLNFVQRDYRRQSMVIGTQGTLYWDFEDPAVRLFDGKSGLWRSFELPYGWSINDMYVDELAYFLSCVEEGVATFCEVGQGWEAVRVALAAKESAARSTFVAPASIMSE
jgi:predicted dehydrogenase